MKRDLHSPGRITPKLTRQIDRHFVACCAAAAGATCLAGSQEAGAAIIYSGLQNVTIFPTTVNGGAYIDLEPNFPSDQGNRITGWDINPYASGQGFYVNGNTKFVVSGSVAANLSPGTLIDGGSSFSNNGGYAGMGIPAGQTGLIGFAFDPDNIAGAQTFFGWARMSIGDNSSTNGSVIDWAYDDSGAPIAAGTAPEPASLGLLALGTVGLLALRRRPAEVK